MSNDPLKLSTHSRRYSSEPKPRRQRLCMFIFLMANVGACLQAHAQVPVATTVAPTPAPYQPSMSDLMNIGVQPRHIKLWLAGKQQNWTYAIYELDELRNAFARVGRTTPLYRTMDVPALIATFTQPSLSALDTAIKEHDAKAFTTAYRQLTDGCNACHQGMQHEMVVIKVPDANAYVDQEFRPRAH